MGASCKSPEQLQASLGWLLPRQHGAPGECLERIRWLCEQVEHLPDAMLLVCATHQGVPRAQLASAVRQFRQELRTLSPEDVQGLLTGLLNGGRDGMDAVLRSRKSAGRRQTALPFVRPD